MSLTGKRAKTATALSSLRRPVRRRSGKASGQRGAGKIGQEEAVQGTAALQVRRMGVEMAWESHSTGGELAGFEMQRRRGRQVLWATWQGRTEGAWHWVGSRRGREAGGSPNRRRGRPVGGNLRRRRWSRAQVKLEEEEGDWGLICKNRKVQGLD